jgi:hypothetical protein
VAVRVATTAATAAAIGPPIGSMVGASIIAAAAVRVAAAATGTSTVRDDLAVAVVCRRLSEYGWAELEAQLEYGWDRGWRCDL